MKKGITLCIATYNEEANIKRTLDSVIDWVDEVILVDGKSTDKTVEIAKGLGKKVKVYLFDNPPNFLLNRQRAMDRANYEWILVLDADEVVSLNLKKEIIKAVSLKDDLFGYNIPRLNYFLQSPLYKGGVYPDYCLRLFKNKVAKIPLESIHDQVLIDGGKDKIGYLKEPLLHYSYPSFQVYLRKWVQYCDHEAFKLKEQKIKPSPWLFTKYMIIYPKWWFLKTYFRHKGFMDGFPGFVFSLFSSLRFPVIYIKLYEKNRSK